MVLAKISFLKLCQVRSRRNLFDWHNELVGQKREASPFYYVEGSKKVNCSKIIIPRFRFLVFGENATKWNTKFPLPPPLFSFVKI